MTWCRRCTPVRLSLVHQKNNEEISITTWMIVCKTVSFPTKLHDKFSCTGWRKNVMRSNTAGERDRGRLRLRLRLEFRLRLLVIQDIQKPYIKHIKNLWISQHTNCSQNIVLYSTNIPIWDLLVVSLNPTLTATWICNIQKGKRFMRQSHHRSKWLE
jgi:hypothetical protein